jgi:hypothetical protein
MSGDPGKTVTPSLLLEASRVLYAAGADYRKAALYTASLALEGRAKAGTDVRAAILGDAAALRLSGQVDGGYQAAIELLKDVGTAHDDDPDGRLHLLRALAYGQKYKASKQARVTDQSLIKLVLDDLTLAFSRNGDLKKINQPFWDPDARAAVAAAGSGPPDIEDDLQDVYLDAKGSSDPDAQKLAALLGA